jgi:hypothetical protein
MQSDLDRFPGAGGIPYDDQGAAFAVCDALGVSVGLHLDQQAIIVSEHGSKAAAEFRDDVLFQNAGIGPGCAQPDARAGDGLVGIGVLYDAIHENVRWAVVSGRGTPYWRLLGERSGGRDEQEEAPHLDP